MTGENRQRGAESERASLARADEHILLDADDDEWAWRRRIRSNPTTARLYRFAIALAGLVVVVLGLALVPLPGPGWLIVFAGLALWASEFEWAQRVLDWVRDRVQAWNRWVRARPWWVQALAALATALVVLAILWLVLRISGVPGFVPDRLEHVLRLG